MLEQKVAHVTAIAIVIGAFLTLFFLFTSAHLWHVTTPPAIMPPPPSPLLPPPPPPPSRARSPQLSFSSAFSRFPVLVEAGDLTAEAEDSIAEAGDSAAEEGSDPTADQAAPSN